MSPAKMHHHPADQPHTLNGPRPSPLKLHRASHHIHKSSSSTSSNSSSICTAVKQQQKPQQPVIIYTHSPKVIHTQAKDFMALVQKLTGHSGGADHSKSSTDGHGNSRVPIKRHDKEGRAVDHNSSKVNNDDNESSSISVEDVMVSQSQGQSNSNSCLFADIPLFTPNSSNFFCSPKPVFRYPDSGYVTPNAGNLLSPSLLEFVKGLPDY